MQLFLSSEPRNSFREEHVHFLPIIAVNHCHPETKSGWYAPQVGKGLWRGRSGIKIKGRVFLEGRHVTSHLFAQVD